MGFPYSITTVDLRIFGRGIDNGHRDYGDTALFCDLKASVMKRKEGIFGFIAGTLRKDADGNAVLD